MRTIAAALVLFGAAVGARPAALHVNDAAILGAGYPASLGEFGFFAGADAKPVPGVTPYRLNTPLWSDGAEKSRFVYVPAGLKAKAQGEGLLDLPVGSALIKTFAFGGRKIETRVLLHRKDGWVAFPYQWNAQQSEARLVLGGARQPIVTPAGQTVSYAIPNKNQCKECHNLDGITAPIGPKAYNLSAAWLRDFARTGHLDRAPQVSHRMPLWEERMKVSAADAARGYLDVNCAHCHNPAGAASNSGLFLGWQVSDPITFGVGKRPVAAGRGSLGLEFDIAPGDPQHSILYRRMTSTEGGVAMPELGRSIRDPDGEAAIDRWIAGMR